MSLLHFRSKSTPHQAVPPPKPLRDQPKTVKENTGVALRPAQERYGFFFEAAPTAVGLFDADGSVLAFNQKLPELTGYTPQEFAHITALDLYVSPEGPRDILRRAISVGELRGHDLVLKRKDGSLCYVVVNVHHMEMEGRSAFLVAGCTVADRSRLRGTLGSHANTLKNLLANSSVGFLKVDMDTGLLLDANDAGSQLLGYYDRDSLLAEPINIAAMYANPDDWEKVTRLLKAGSEPFQNYEARLASDNGSEKWARVSTRFVRKKGWVEKIFIDITYHKQLERDLSLHMGRTKALLALHQISNEPDEIILEFVLEASLESCRSQFAFFGLLDETESCMTVRRWSKSVAATCSLTNRSVHFSVTETGLCGECIRQRKPVIVNDCGAYPGKQGYPCGHVPIQRFLSVPIFDGDRIVAIAAVANKNDPYTVDDIHALTSLMNKTWEILRRKRAEENLLHTTEQLRKGLGATVRTIAAVVEARDPYTSGHQRRVADLTRAIAKEMGLSQDQADGLRMAALIHDIGKIAVPAEILSKPARLAEVEFSLIKRHPQAGYGILKDVEFPWPVARMILEHHERIDGSGYPHGLTGAEILPESKILAVADVVEAMASHRPYRPNLGIDKALLEIEENKGILYEPDVADACLKLFRENNFQLQEDLPMQDLSQFIREA
jgi:PAS domain S-box-containing protein